MGNLVLADITVARTADFGVNDTTYYVRSHLGGILHPGDSVLGYDLENKNWNSDLWDQVDQDRVQSVILIKKVLSEDDKNSKRKTKNRKWRLKRMAVEHNEREEIKASEAASGETIKLGKHDAAMQRQERDYEEFLDELEQDEELREGVEIYLEPSDNEGDDDGSFGEEDEELPELDIEGLDLEDSEEEEAKKDGNKNAVSSDDEQDLKKDARAKRKERKARRKEAKLSK